MIENCYKMWADTPWVDKNRNDGMGRSDSKTDGNHSKSTNQTHSSQPSLDGSYWKANTTRFLSFNSVSSSPDEHEWIVDSASNTHLTPFKPHLLNYHEFSTPGIVEGLGNKRVSALGSGDVILMDPSGHRFILHDVLYVPDHSSAILSFNKLRQSGIDFRFLEIDNDDGDFILSSPNSRFHLIGHAANDILYVHDISPLLQVLTTRKRRRRSLHPAKPFPSLRSPSITGSSSSTGWHLYLCHAPASRTSSLEHLLGHQDHEMLDCLACI